MKVSNLMPNLVLSHVGTLPRPLACPSLAIRSDGTGLIVGSGIVAFKPGAPPIDLNDDTDEVPVEPGVAIGDDDVLACYGGHMTGEEHGALETVSFFDVTSGKFLDVGEPLPFARRGICAVRHGKKVAMFGGRSIDNVAARDIVIAKDGNAPHALRATFPVSCDYLQVGKIGKALYLLGSAAQDWQPPKAGFDIKVTMPEDVVIAETVPALQGKPRLGVCVIQVSETSFLAFGGADGNGGVNASLTLVNNAGTTTIGDVVDANGEPYAVCYSVGMYEASEKAIYLLAGLRGSPFSSSAKATDRIVRIQLA